MKQFLKIAIVFAVIAISPALKAELLVLSYHNVDGGSQAELKHEAMSISNKSLTEQFSWLKHNDYQVITIDQLIAANEGKTPLPKKAVLLTFDDGYKGMYQYVYPLLKRFKYPAVLALMGDWLETPNGEQVNYGDSTLSRDYFLSWEQIREMADSGLVELASHSYDLHKGIVANPQGNVQPAAVSLRYDSDQSQYEKPDAYRNRIFADLNRSVKLIKQKTGRDTRIMVWPYGAYNQVTIDIAKQLGMFITMSLDGGYTDVNNLSNVHRLLVGNRSDIGDFSWLINDGIAPKNDPVRVIHVDLDYIYDADPAQQERNLGKLLERVKAMGVSTVYLQAFADPDGDGNANSLYFPNRHLPMRADLFNRVSWQLRTRSFVEVYAWMPVMSFDLPAAHPLLKHRVIASPVRKQEDYRRLSPFSEEALAFVGDIYEDLAMHAQFSGVIFHDDAYLSDHEDASLWAMKAYAAAGLPSDMNVIRRDPDLFKQWTSLKSHAIAQWTDALTERVKKYQANIKTARNMYASVIMNPESEQWFAQSMTVFLKHYDYTAVMAMPYMEKAKNPERWLRKLVQRVEKIPGALKKTVFELQSVDWRKKKPIAAEELAQQMQTLLQSGALHFGYYPDDFIQGVPALEIIRPAISLASTPQE